MQNINIMLGQNVTPICATIKIGEFQGGKLCIQEILVGLVESKFKKSEQIK